MVGLLNDEPYLPHGIDVAYSAVYTQRLREQLLADKMRNKEMTEKTEQLPENSAHAEKYCFPWGKWEEKIKKVYGKAADGVIALQRKLDWYSVDRRGIYREKWDEIQEILKEVPSSTELTGYLNSVGLNLEQFEQLYGEKKIADAIKYAKDLKDRYSILWMYYDFLFAVSHTL